MKLKLLLSFSTIILGLQISVGQYEGYSLSNWEEQLEIEELFFKNLDATSFKNHLKNLQNDLMWLAVKPTLLFKSIWHRLWKMLD